MQRRRHDRLTRPGRRQTDRRLPLADNRRVLLVGEDEEWRLLTAYLFEEAGYTACAAGDVCQAARFAARLLPDVVVVRMDAHDTLEVLMRLPAEHSSTSDIPIVVLTASLESAHAQRVRAFGGMPLVPHATDMNALVGEVDTLIPAAARGPRALKRRLLDLQELARYHAPDEEGKARLRRLIDHLQVAIFAVDERGHCIAASQGATTLTGYTRVELLTKLVFQIGFVRGHQADARWGGFLANRQDAGITTITNRAGEDVAVHAAGVAEILPGFHIAAFAAAESRLPRTQSGPVTTRGVSAELRHEP
jgi:PAS domain S-box-containing protein